MSIAREQSLHHAYPQPRRGQTIVSVSWYSVLSTNIVFSHLMNASVFGQTQRMLHCVSYSLAAVDDGGRPGQLHLAKYVVLLVVEPKLLNHAIFDFC